MIFIAEVLDRRDSEPRDGVTVWITFEDIIGVSQRKEKTNSSGIARFDLSPHRPGSRVKISIGHDDVYEGPIDSGTRTFFV